VPPSLTTPNNRLPSGPWVWSAVLGAALAALALSGVELALRSQGYGASVTDDGGLWALEFSDRGPDDWLFLGSSRAACAVDLQTFEQETGQRAVQLAISAGQPVPVLTYLNDHGFAGRLIVELTPQIWFVDDPGPTQISQSYLQALYDQERALFGGLERRATRSLQSSLRILHTEMDMFDLVKAAVRGEPPAVANELRPNRQRYCFPSRQGAAPEVGPPDLSDVIQARPAQHDERLDAAVLAIDGITARGGSVLLFAAPESGTKRNTHLLTYPDALYAGVLVQRTGMPFVDAMTDPVLSQLAVPDYSHIDTPDAPVFTARLVERFQEDGDLPRP
jgi:hypothetical protein